MSDFEIIYGRDGNWSVRSLPPPRLMEYPPGMFPGKGVRLPDTAHAARREPERV